jgi:uncharacterized protein YigA (DUF484 family)
MTPLEKTELKRLYRKRDKLLSHGGNNEKLNDKIRALQSTIIDR